MLRTALRNVFAHKARLLMTVLAVLLGVAFVSGTLVFTSTISAAFQKSSEKGFSNVDLAIEPPKGGPRTPGPPTAQTGEKRLTQATLDKARKLPGAESASGSVRLHRARRQEGQARRRGLADQGRQLRRGPRRP